METCEYSFSSASHNPDKQHDSFYLENGSKAALEVLCLLCCRVTKHIYYPAGASVTAEKPLIYDKVESLGAGQGAGLGYQTTQLSTFRPGPGAESVSSAESSCSALCPGPGDKLCHAPHQVTVITVLVPGVYPD